MKKKQIADDEITTESELKHSCSSCEYLNIDFSCVQKGQGTYETSGPTSCSLYQRRCCRNCDVGFQKILCDLSAHTRSDKYCIIEPSY